MHASTFDHEADIGVAGEGATLEEAFVGAARAMFGVITEPARVEALRAVEISCRASDPELLLVNWLNALLAEADLSGMLFCRFEATIEEDRLRGRAWGESFDARRHARGVEVKGATLTELSVERRGSRWYAQTVVDV